MTDLIKSRNNVLDLMGYAHLDCRNKFEINNKSHKRAINNLRIKDSGGLLG